MKTLRIFITGTVQGVFFRRFVKDNADNLEIKGYVRNLSDGRLEAVIEGKDENVNELIKVIKAGPPHATVKNIDKQDLNNQGFKEFKILRM